MSSIIKNYQISFSIKDKCDYQFKDKNAFCKLIRSNSTLLLVYIKIIINKKYKPKLINKINRSIESIGIHIVMILFMENFMTRVNNNNFNKKEQNNSNNMEKTIFINYHHLMFIENHLYKIILSLFQKLCKFLMNATLMLKNDIKQNMQFQMNIKKEIGNRMIKMIIF